MRAVELGQVLSNQERSVKFSAEEEKLLEQAVFFYKYKFTEWDDE